jgi:hypothetical protein
VIELALGGQIAAKGIGLGQSPPPKSYNTRSTIHTLQRGGGNDDDDDDDSMAI